MDAGRDIALRLVQLANTLVGRLVTLLGIVIDLSEVQPENAFDPIEVTLLGIEIEVREEQL